MRRNGTVKRDVEPASVVVVVFGQFLQKASTTIDCATVAVELAVLHRVDCVVVVPAEFCAGTDGLGGKKCYPWKAQVICVDEHVLNKQIGRTAVVEVAADVSQQLGVHDVN